MQLSLNLKSFFFFQELYLMKFYFIIIFWLMVPRAQSKKKKHSHLQEKVSLKYKIELINVVKYLSPQRPCK